MHEIGAGRAGLARGKARQAAADIRARSAGVRLKGPKIRNLVDEGRP